MEWRLIKNNTIGMKLEQIINLQRILGVSETGFLDELTQGAIKNFQLRAGIPATGFIDETTISKLELLTDFKAVTTDDTEIGTYNNESPSIDEMFAVNFSTDMFESIGPYSKFHMKPEQYFNDDIEKTCIFLHHTAGWENPYSTIKWWGSDDRGQIGTQFVIGGVNIKTGENKFDGKTLEAFPEGSWAYHLGGKAPLELTKKSIGIELCNFGYLIEKYGTFYTYTGNIVDEKYVTELNDPFRGHKYYHSYTAQQIESLRKLLVFLGSKYYIDLTCGMREWLIGSYNKVDAFEYKDNIFGGPYCGIYSHTNVRKDKFDVYPHPLLIEMIESL